VQQIHPLLSTYMTKSHLLKLIQQMVQSYKINCPNDNDNISLIMVITIWPKTFCLYSIY